ncbi:MAG: MAPEG family protein [Burkholderiales bacterium]
MKAAHHDAVENLVVFAALVLIVGAMNVRNEATAAACATYFWARLVHLLVYTFGVPWLRTLAFAVGFVCQVVLAWQILA